MLTDEVINIPDEIIVLRKQLRNLRIGVAIGCLSVLFMVFIGYVANGIHTHNYEKRMTEEMKQFKWDVQIFTGKQLEAIKGLNQLVELIKPFAKHREIQLIDYYKQELWKLEQKHGHTKSDGSGHTNVDRRKVSKDVQTPKKKGSK